MYVSSSAWSRCKISTNTNPRLSVETRIETSVKMRVKSSVETNVDTRVETDVDTSVQTKQTLTRALKHALIQAFKQAFKRALERALIYSRAGTVGLALLTTSTTPKRSVSSSVASATQTIAGVSNKHHTISYNQGQGRFKRISFNRAV